MVKVDTVEGVIGDYWFHYDLGNDVLYLRLELHRRTPVVGEPTDDDLFRMRSLDDGEIVGLEVVGWWKRFGKGPRPDSMSELARLIEPWTRRVAS